MRGNWRHYGVNPILLLALVSWALLTLTRLGLTLWYWEQVPQGGLSSIFWGGLRGDLATLCALYALPLLTVSVLALVRKPLGRWLTQLLSCYCALVLAFLMLNEAATPSFILEYGVRPNHLYVQYLQYPREVFAMLWQGHQLSLLACVALTVVTLGAGYRLARWALHDHMVGGRVYGLALLLVTLAVVPLGIRSTLGHRPLNPAIVAFCNNPLINSLPLNSSYSAVYALAHLGDSTIGGELIYQRINNQSALTVLPEFSARSAGHGPINQVVTPWPQVPDSPVPVGHSALHPKTDTMGPYNLVIIVEESLGDNFIASQGGWPLTPTTPWGSS